MPEAEFANSDSTEETQEYVPQQPIQEYTTPLAAEQTQIRRVQMSSRGKSSSEKQRPQKRRVVRNFPRRKLGLFRYAVLVIALVAASYFQSTTRVEVTADKFIKAVDTKDYP